jgi:hypothetical protein
MKSEEFAKEREILQRACENFLYSQKHPTLFPELMRILIEAVVVNSSMVLIADCPEILNRMHIAANYSLDEMLDIFNSIMS